MNSKFSSPGVENVDTSLGVRFRLGLPEFHPLRGLEIGRRGADRPVAARFRLDHICAIRRQVMPRSESSMPTRIEPSNVSTTSTQLSPQADRRP